MSLHALTSANVDQKITELYALPDADLFEQATAIERNFRTWLSSNFQLTTDQSIYLTNMDDEVVNYYGARCALCFRHRLDIILIYPLPPVNPGYKKWTEATDTIAVRADGTGNSEVTGKLTFTMVYRPFLN